MQRQCHEMVDNKSFNVSLCRQKNWRSCVTITRLTSADKFAQAFKQQKSTRLSSMTSSLPSRDGADRFIC